MKTSVKKIINVSAADAWKVISRIKDIEQYLPGISSSEVSTRGGRVYRSIILLDGLQYEEVIKNIDHDSRELTYIISDPSPFPYSNLQGSISIIAISTFSCEVTWICTYDPGNGAAEEIDIFLSLIMSLGIKGVAKVCRRKPEFA